MLGSIIRIGAREVHVDDAKFFYQLHRSTQNIEKDKSYYIALTALVSAHSKEERRRKGPPSRPFITPPPHQDTKSASLARWYIFANGFKSLKILNYLMRIVRGRLTQCAPSILIMILGYALWMILDDRRTLRIGTLRGFILFSALFQKSSLRL
jgi:hypothetical protein